MANPTPIHFPLNEIVIFSGELRNDINHPTNAFVDILSKRAERCSGGSNQPRVCAVSPEVHGNPGIRAQSEASSFVQHVINSQLHVQGGYSLARFHEYGPGTPDIVGAS